jgi:hypothetical protein
MGHSATMLLLAEALGLSTVTPVAADQDMAAMTPKPRPP